MNSNQKALLIFVMCLIAAMLLFPPFHLRFPTGFVENMGYGFLLAPPLEEYNSVHGRVDIGMLVTQWLCVIVIGAIGFFLLRDK